MKSIVNIGVYILLLSSTMILMNCKKKYKQDLNDTSPPTFEVGLSVDQNNMPSSKTEWGRTKDYVQLKYIRPGQKGREYEFYVGVEDKGGLEEVTIQVCPANALVPGSIDQLKKTFNPQKTGTYLVSGKIRPLKRGERVSIRAIARGKDRNGSKSSSASIYAIANTVRYNMGGRNLENLCNTQSNTSFVRIGLKRPTHTTSGSASYSGCYFDGDFRTIARQCPNRPSYCYDATGTISKTIRGKFIVNDNPNDNIIIIAPNGSRHTIPKNRKVSYNGPIYGKWTGLITSSGALTSMTYIKVEY